MDSSGSTTYEAVVSFAPRDLVRPDMAANLSITTQVWENVLLVPNRIIQTLGRRKVVKRLGGVLRVKWRSRRGCRTRRTPRSSAGSMQATCCSSNSRGCL